MNKKHKVILFIIISIMILIIISGVITFDVKYNNETNNNLLNYNYNKEITSDINNNQSKNNNTSISYIDSINKTEVDSSNKTQTNTDESPLLKYINKSMYNNKQNQQISPIKSTILNNFSEKETFKINNFQKNNNILCVFVCCHNNEDDYNFINNNKDNVDFYVINSCYYPNIYTSKIKMLLPKENYLTRLNTGWDTTAWKEFILDNYNEILSYDYIILANNSCRYDFNIISLINIAKNYQFFGLNESKEINPHYQSYFIIIRKDLFNTKDFYNYWLNMPIISSRQDAINNHELKFMEYFLKKGYITGKYLKKFVQVYNIDSYIGLDFKVDFIKKTAIEKKENKNIYEKQLKTFN